MNQAVWLEVALNGPWSRSRQPGIPILGREIVEEAVACAGEGAAIIHFHAYDEVTGKQRDDYEIYAPIIERIRARTDVICYPTLPLTGSLAAMDSRQRFSAVERLARAGLIEWTVVDPGSLNIATFADIAQQRDGFLYANAEADTRHGLALCRELNITPSYAIYEPGFIRAGAALHKALPGTPRPVYRFMFSDQFTFGLPPSEWALDAYLRLLAEQSPGAPWMLAGLGVELESLIPATVRRGGHIRVGLEDAPLGSASSNRALTQRATAAVAGVGAPLATAAEIRAASTKA